MKNTDKNIISYDHLFNGLYQFIDSDGQYWYSGIKAAALIGLKNPEDIINIHISDEEKHLFKRRQFYDNVLSYYDVSNAGEVLITKNGLLQLLINSNSLNNEAKKEFAKKFGLELEPVAPCYSKFIYNLKEILEYLGIHSIRDYKLMHEYRIDLYIPKYRLAIEYYDNSCNSKKDFTDIALRELTIKKVFDCNFIRLHDIDSDNKNIANVINKILEIEKFIL